jgi:heme/copper-type cytochrome/quinol oxidase subunit 4
MSFKEFVKELNGSKAEGEIAKTIFVSLVVSFVVLALLYFFRLRYIEDFIPKYGFYLFFAILSYAAVMPAIRQVRSFKQFPCMSGMMIGMTIGMMIGFLAGFYVGATNGMFYGGFFGVAVGVLFGAWNGKCCGIMGVMEGMMAGFMGGLMGAMTSVMMLNDNLKVASVLIFLVCGAILIGLNYMIYVETKSAKREIKEGQFFTVFWSFVLTVATIWLMVFGPRSLLFS